MSDFEKFKEELPSKKKFYSSLTNRKINDEECFLMFGKNLKSDSHLPNKICVICLIESPLTIMENAFYFILKALFVLKIFKILSRLFSDVGKMA